LCALFIQGWLPVVLMFDVKEDNEVEPGKRTQLNTISFYLFYITYFLSIFILSFRSFM